MTVNENLMITLFVLIGIPILTFIAWLISCLLKSRR